MYADPSAAAATPLPKSLGEKNGRTTAAPYVRCHSRLPSGEYFNRKAALSSAPKLNVVPVTYTLPSGATATSVASSSAGPPHVVA
jgi:hypothetical protein